MVEEVAKCGVTEDLFKCLRSLIPKDSAEFGVEGGHGSILSRVPAFASIEATVSE